MAYFNVGATYGYLYNGNSNYYSRQRYSTIICPFVDLIQSSLFVHLLFLYLNIKQNSMCRPNIKTYLRNAGFQQIILQLGFLFTIIHYYYLFW